MKNDFFEELLEFLNYSGARCYQVILSGTGYIDIEHNWNVKKETMEILKNKYPDYNISSTNPKEFKRLRKINKESLEENLRETTLFKTLLHWIGNDTITFSMASDIRRLLSNSEYKLYIFWGQALSKRETYQEILCERFVESCAFIFESEKDIKSISLMWTD